MFADTAVTQVHYLCSHSYSSATVFPDEDIPRAVSHRDNLLAAALLASDNDSVYSDKANSDRSRAMDVKIRFASDLAKRASEVRRGGGGCPECEKAVRV